MVERSTPKTMSSRLMTMKFMQRGAAQAAAEAAASPSTPNTEDESSASKRRKTAHASTPGTPTPNTPLYDQKAIQAALEEEEKKRAAAIEKRAAELGDSYWVLDGASVPPSKTGSRQPLNVVQVGFGQIDYAGTVDGNSDFVGTVDISTKARFQYNIKRKVEEKKSYNNNDSHSHSESGSSEDESEDDQASPADQSRGRHESTPSNKQRTRSSLDYRRSEERKKAQDFAEKRRKKEVNLNKLTSISGSGTPTQKPAFNCFRCGKPGHKAPECPKKH